MEVSPVAVGSLCPTEAGADRSAKCTGGIVRTGRAEAS
jgi:hypothetical protein